MERIASLVRRLNEQRTVYRAPILAVALAVFGVGCVVSYRQTGIALGDLEAGPLVGLAALVVPSLLYGGIGLILLAKSAGLAMKLGRATSISAVAYLSELLPLPGGAIVRAGALVNAGGSLGLSSALVLLTALLWVALAVMGAGLTLLVTAPALAWPLMFAGTAATAGVTGWLWRVAGLRLASLTLVHRVSGIALTAIRLQFAFAALGASIGLVETFPFVLALLLGSASSIAPAGLGVSESLAALAATTSHFPPSIAFLAVGLDRLMCLAGCALIVLGRQLAALRSVELRLGAASSPEVK